MFLWMVTLEVIKQVCCFPSTQVNDHTSNNLFLVSNLWLQHRFSSTGKAKYFYILLLLEVS